MNGSEKTYIHHLHECLAHARKRLRRKRKQLRECREEKHRLEIRLCVLEERYEVKP